eukprot:s1935_g1.t2
MEQRACSLGASSVLPAIAAAARRRATGEALRWLCRTGAQFQVERWTYAEVWQCSIDAAGALRAHGVTSRALVGVAVDEGPALPLLELAVLLANGQIVPLDVCDPPGRLAVLLRDSEPVLAVAKDDAGLKALAQASAEAFAETGAGPALMLASALGLDRKPAKEAPCVVLFLDIDGVLHPVAEHGELFLPDRMYLLKQLISRSRGTASCTCGRGVEKRADTKGPSELQALESVCCFWLPIATAFSDPAMSDATDDILSTDGEVEECESCRSRWLQL